MEWLDMRRILSYSLGYEPPPGLVGTRFMEEMILIVESNVMPSFGLVEVIKMCQDIGADHLLRRLLRTMWTREWVESES